MTLAPLNRTLDQELAALVRGASLECLVCGEFVLHAGAAVKALEILREGDEVRFRHTTPYPAHALNTVKSALDVIRRAASAEEYETAALQTE